MRTTRSPLIWLLLPALLLLSSCRSSTNAPTSDSSAPAASVGTPKPAHLNYALVGAWSWTSLDQIVAQEKGFYAAENLTVDFVVAGQSASACQQVIAKAAEVGACSISDMIQVMESSNAPVFQFVGMQVQPLNYSIMAKPNLKSWADLKGKTVIVGGPKDNTVFFFRAMARPNGLKDSDYDFQYAGASSARFAALKSGAVDAAILTDPFDFTAEQSGYAKVDALVPKYVNSGNYGYVIAAARKDWAKDHPDELARFIRAQLKAVAWIYDPAHKQEAMSLAASKGSVPQDSVERLYQRDVVNGKFWSTDGTITDAGVQGVLNSLVELGSLKTPTPPPNKYYDLTYLNLALQGQKR